MSPCTCRWVTRNRATARVLASVFRLYRAVVVIEECEAWWRQMLEVGPCIRALGDAAGSAVSVLHIIGYPGGVTEGSDAGADLEHLRHHASHSSITTTARYSRKTLAKTRAVARLRVTHRQVQGDMNGT